MFDLEAAIAGWRMQMLAAGIKTPVPLDELEFHVREEIERQVKSGLNTPQAFAAAVQQIGQANALKQEFEKAERTFMKRTLIILAGILGVLLGMALIMPAAHLYKEQGMMHNAVVGFSWGIPIVLFGVGTAVFGLKRRKA